MTFLAEARVSGDSRALYFAGKMLYQCEDASGTFGLADAATAIAKLSSIPACVSTKIHRTWERCRSYCQNDGKLALGPASDSFARSAEAGDPAAKAVVGIRLWLDLLNSLMQRKAGEPLVRDNVAEQRALRLIKEAADSKDPEALGHIAL